MVLWWSQLTQNCMDHPYELSSAVVRTVLDLILMILACQILLLMMMILDPVDHLQHNLRDDVCQLFKLIKGAKIQSALKNLYFILCIYSCKVNFFIGTL